MSELRASSVRNGGGATSTPQTWDSRSRRDLQVTAHPCADVAQAYADCQAAGTECVRTASKPLFEAARTESHGVDAQGWRQGDPDAVERRRDRFATGLRVSQTGHSYGGSGAMRCPVVIVSAAQLTKSLLPLGKPITVGSHPEYGERRTYRFREGQ